jgi:glycosyltransferase involved in cell wall biosynthesis
MNYKDLPLVTAFTLIYNNASICIESIDCIRLNNYPNLEHIIIDDGSNDEFSINIIENYIKTHNYQCTYIKNDKNAGICKSLNLILKISKGKYIFGLSDDIIFENKIINDVLAFENLTEDFAVVHSMLQYMNFDGSVKYPFIIPTLDYPKTFSDDLSLKDIIKSGGLIATPTVLMRKKSLVSVGGWDEDILYEDTQMWFKLAFNNLKFHFRAELTTYYRRSLNQISNLNPIERPGYLIEATKIYGPYLNLFITKKALFSIYLNYVLANNNSEVQKALRFYKKLPHKSYLFYYLFRYNFWGIFLRFFKKIRII